jgi:hypothetical protein
VRRTNQGGLHILSTSGSKSRRWQHGGKCIETQREMPWQMMQGSHCGTMDCGLRLFTAMAEKMNQAMVFDHSAATQNLGFSSRIFQPSGVN